MGSVMHVILLFVCLSSIFGKPTLKKSEDDDDKSGMRILHHLGYLLKQKALPDIEGPCAWIAKSYRDADASKPDCDAKGFFKTKQCNESECQCVTRKGVKIQNYGAKISEAEDMNCKCAFVQDLFRDIKFYGPCKNNGNHDTYFCLLDQCFCVDENGNDIHGSKTVYKGDLDTLHC